jgi:hypothetical protein
MGCGCAKAGVLGRSSNATVKKSSVNLIVYEVNVSPKINKEVDEVVEDGTMFDVLAGGEILASDNLK